MKRLSVLILSSLLMSMVFSGTPRAAFAEGNNCTSIDSPGCTYGLPTDTYNKLLEQMNAHPTPDVTPIDEAKKEVWSYSFYRILPDTDLYDAPHGNALGKFPDGFNFVSLYKQKDGYAMLRDGRWVQKSSLKQTFASEYTGIQIDKPLLFPMAWVIQASIPATVPGGARDPKTPAIARYTRLNIFATVRVDGWDWYLVGPGQWLEQRKVARIMPAERPDGAQKWAAVDLFEQVLSVYDGDNLVFATLISSGLTQFQTNIGTFKVWRRATSTPMSGAMGKPDFYSLPAVPYVMFFDNEISLHGTYWHDGFGFKHSHGCVNMSISDAEWLFNWSDGVDLTVKVWDSHDTKGSAA